MKGEVTQIHQERRLVAVLTDREEYTILEILGGELAEGDILKWQGDYPLGEQPVYNLSKHQQGRARIGAHRVRVAELRQHLRLL